MGGASDDAKEQSPLAHTLRLFHEQATQTGALVPRAGAGAGAGASAGASPVAPSPEILTGASRYRARGEIGAGGMGRVLEAIDEQFGRRVALKELHAESLNTEWQARFLVEALVTAGLEHPGVPSVYERGVRDGVPFYAMRLVEGRTLREAISDCESAADRLKLLPAVLSVAQTLAFAHERGVIHRDVKPHNVVLAKHGQTVLLDWGIAKVRGADVAVSSTVVAALGEQQATGAKQGAGVDESVKTRLGAVFGTPAYMAPEQALGRVEQIDERTDVFALGALLYHVLSGRAPYDGKTGEIVIEQARAASPPSIDRVAAHAPIRLREIVAKAMSARPSRRFASAADFAAALEGFTADAVRGAPSRTVEFFAIASAIVAVLVVILGTVAALVAASFHEMGPAMIGVTIIGVLGCCLSAVEMFTRGRHRLEALARGFAAVTVLGSLAATAFGLVKTLAGVESHGAPSAMLLAGARESLQCLAWGTQLAALQMVLWAIARRRAQSPKKADEPS